MTSTISFNPDAPSFEFPKRETRPQNAPQNARRPNNNQRPAQQGQRPQTQRKNNQNQDKNNSPQAGSSVLPFVVSTSLINVGNKGVKTMEAARPTLKAFSMEQQFKDLARETDIKRVLRHRWTMWLQQSRSPQEKADVVDYMSEIQEFGTFNTIPEFCQYWNKTYLEGNPPYSKIVVFKKGIKPVWEDPDNKKGGRYVIRGSTLEETLSMFLVIICRMMTGRLQGDYNDLVGAVLQAKGSDQLWIQVWNKDASDDEQTSRFKINLNKLVNRTVAYQVHDQSAKMQKSRLGLKEDKPAPKEESTPSVAQTEVDDYVKNFLQA